MQAIIGLDDAAIRKACEESAQGSGFAGQLQLAGSGGYRRQ